MLKLPVTPTIQKRQADSSTVTPKLKKMQCQFKTIELQKSSIAVNK